MNQNCCTFYPFMRAVRGNWRNALFISCGCQTCRPLCKGFLMAVDADGRPLLMPVETLRQLTGESIDFTDCQGVLEKQAFEAAYSQYIEWHTVSENDCSLLQLYQDGGPLDCRQLALKDVIPP